MKKILVVFALFAALIFVVSCGGNSSSKTSDSGTSDSTDHGNSGNGGSDSESGDAGIHLGIIGFNYQTTEMDIRLLTDSNKSSFINFIDNLQQDNNTALYYADDTALDMMAEYDKPPKLQHVALVTFTDGIDNQSIGLKPEYNDPDDYLNDLHKKIVSNKIHGLSVEAYSIGLKTKEEFDNENENEKLEQQFETILKEGLASSTDKAFVVDNMDEVSEIFAVIADNLVKVSTSINYGVYMPGGYPDGQVIRYIFDNKSAKDSSLYIEATYKKQNRKLENITYHGFAKGDGTIQATDGPKGSLYYQFDDLRYSNGTTVSQNMSFVLWKQVSGSWMTESEITAADYPPVVKKEMSSALIMMVLDCTTSLSSENFKEMKKIAKDFVRTLSGESGGSSNSENNDENGNENNPDDSDSCAAVDGNMWSSMSSSTMTWQEALAYCGGLNECGYSDWKLPDINELRMLIQNCPATETGGLCAVSEPDLLASSDWSDDCCCEYKENNAGYYSRLGDDDNVYLWSSSAQSDGAGYAWRVGFSRGDVYYGSKYDEVNVRCVR